MSKHKMLQILSNKKAMSFDKERWRVFGNWLKTHRETAKLSQDGLGDLIGVDRQTIYRLENALTGTKRETVLALAKALNQDEGDALIKAGFAPQNTENNIPQPIKEALSTSENLDDGDMQLIANFIRMLNNQKNGE